MSEDVVDGPVRKGAVIVTGGGNGLGRGMALRLADLGYAVLAGDIDEAAAESVAAEAAAAGASARGMRLDVTDRASCRAAVEYADGELGGLYGLVNNAGVGKARAFMELSDADWDRTFGVNARGTFLMTQEAARPLLARSSGSIVNVSSIAGVEGYPNWSDYGATKHAMIGLTKALAREFGPDNVRVNAVCPGAVKTAIWGSGPQSTDDPDAIFDQLAAKTALGRNQTVEEIADAVAFLIGPRSATITGQSLLVDSGLIMA